MWRDVDGMRRMASRAAPLVVAFAAASALAQSLPSGDIVATDLVARARAYEHGEGVNKDMQRAAALYCDAARNGDAEALFSLGWLYANGRGVSRDDSVAGALFTQAAALGYEQAQRLLQMIGAERPVLPDCLMQSAADASMVVDPETGTVALTYGDDDPFANLPPTKKKIAELVTQTASRYAVDPRLALAVVAAESNFDPDARSNKDARGLMQLIPETAARFNVRNAFNLGENLRGGLTYLRWLLAYYRGEVPLAIAAYNAGERAVDRYRGIPPYPETREYVGKVLGWFRQDRHPYDPNLVEPSPIVSVTSRAR